MPPATIEDPIINPPYGEPSRHFRFDEEGITNEIVEKRRLSGYMVFSASTDKGQEGLS